MKRYVVGVVHPAQAVGELLPRAVVVCRHPARHGAAIVELTGCYQRIHDLEDVKARKIQTKRQNIEQSNNGVVFVCIEKFKHIEATCPVS